jgi:hypothetical protein
MRDAESAEK